VFPIIDFTIARFFTGEPSTAIVSSELSQFAYNFEADTLITQHTPLRYFHSWNSTELPLSSHKFYPAQDPLASAFHLFFATIFASNPNIYQSIPGCIPIPLFPLSSEQFDVEFLRRYERRLFFSSLNTKDINYTIPEYEEHFGPENIYADSGFASSSHYVSEARLIEGEWMGYYTFQDLEDSEATNTTPTIEDWFDGPMRLTLKIVPLEDAVQNGGEQQPLPPSWISRWEDDEKNSTNSNEPRKRRKLTNTSSEPFPASHLRSCPLTRFEGTGVDNLGTFSITGLVDDTEEGQVTWEKHYVDSGERWEYSGRFAWPMGLCGRWGDEEYGGPWWMWKISNNETALPTISTITK
jgi:hypothetical protein